jgi:hypothetical protein
LAESGVVRAPKQFEVLQSDKMSLMHRRGPRMGKTTGEVARHFSVARCGVSADYIESEKRAALFTRSANTAIERVFVLITV